MQAKDIHDTNQHRGFPTHARPTEPPHQIRAERRTPDLLGIAYGVPVAIETKSAKGPQRQAQINFEKRWVEEGGIYILARREADVWAALAARISPETLADVPT